MMMFFVKGGLFGMIFGGVVDFFELQGVVGKIEF